MRLLFCEVKKKGENYLEGWEEATDNSYIKEILIFLN